MTDRELLETAYENAQSLSDSLYVAKDQTPEKGRMHTLSTLARKVMCAMTELESRCRIKKD